MSSKRNWKMGVTLVLAIAFMVTSGGLVIGSNLGFKINRNVLAQFTGAAGPKNSNRIALPYNHPYTNATSLCTALGIPAVAGNQIRKLNPQNGQYGTCTPSQCCTISVGPGCCCPPIVPGCAADPACLALAGGPHPLCTEMGFTTACLQPNASLPDQNIGCLSSSGFEVHDTSASPASHGGVLVGSSNETKPFPPIRGLFSAGSTPTNDNWVSVPYHTTWVNALDVCGSLPGCIGVNTCSVTRLNPLDGTFSGTNFNCALPGTDTKNFTVVLGESIRIELLPAYSNPTAATQCAFCSGGTTPGAVCGGTFPACAGGGICTGTITQNICGFLPPHF